MNIIKILFSNIIVVISATWATAQLTSSNLPIIVIETQGTIEDEPKSPGTMKIIYDEEGGRNILDSDEYHFEGKIGIELRGQSSLSLFPKNGFGIETRESDDSNLNVSIFGWPAENDWVIHSPYSDKTLIRNHLTYTLSGKIMEYAPRTKMCELILNDDYYGVILFTEKIKRDKGRLPISKLKKTDNDGDQLTGGYILKFDKAKGEEIAWSSPYPPYPGAYQEAQFIHVYPKHDEITDLQLEYIRSYITEFENRLKSTTYQDSILGYRPLIDVESFIDYIIINELTRNVDAYRLSTYMYKDRDSLGGKLSMGPVWDYNLAWGNANYCNGGNKFGWAYQFNEICPNDFWINHFWWERLISDRSFSCDLQNRWIELRSEILSDNSLRKMIDEKAEHLNEAQERNFSRWPVLGQYIWPNNIVGSNYTAEINNLKRWTQDRLDWLDDQWGPTEACEEVITPSDLPLVYPNPTSSVINISLTKAKCNTCTFNLYDGSGRIIYTYKLSEDTFLDVSNLNGLYFYNVLNESTVVLENGKLSIIN